MSRLGDRHPRIASLVRNGYLNGNRVAADATTPMTPDLEPVRYRYTGPPQVTMDTWKPGRPRSAVIDYSRSSSFNVPYAKKEKPLIAAKSEDVLDLGRSRSVDQIDEVFEEKSIPAVEQRKEQQQQQVATPVEKSEAAVVHKKETVEPVKEEKVAAHPVKEVEVEPPVAVEPLAVRDKIDHIEKTSSGGDKPVVMRKSSFLTARPFEARPVSMPIKRPNFAPMVQPVPFVSRKIRAPEVRGFASLPPVDNETATSPTAGKAPTMSPVSSVSKPRSVAQPSTTTNESPAIVNRNKLIQSARRPSAEIEGSPLKSQDSPKQVCLLFLDSTRHGVMFHNNSYFHVLVWLWINAGVEEGRAQDGRVKQPSGIQLLATLDDASEQQPSPGRL